MGIQPAGHPRSLSQDQLIQLVIADLVIMGVASCAGASLALRTLDRAAALTQQSQLQVIEWFRVGW
jgi:hypothetical protein